MNVILKTEKAYTTKTKYKSWLAVLLLVQVIFVHGLHIPTTGYQLQHVKSEKCIKAVDLNAAVDIPEMHNCIESAILSSSIFVLQGTYPHGKLLAAQYLTSNKIEIKCLTTRQYPYSDSDLLQLQPCPLHIHSFRKYDWLFFRNYNYPNRFQIFHRDSEKCLGLNYDDTTLQLKYCSEADITLHWQRYLEQSNSTTEQPDFINNITKQPTFVNDTNQTSHNGASDTTYVFLCILLAIILLCATLCVGMILRTPRFYQPVVSKNKMDLLVKQFYDGAVEKINPNLNAVQQTELLPFDKRWEFPYENLELGDKLGSGAFGSVFKAEARGILESEAITTVAVKTVDQMADEICFEALVSELKVLSHLGKHLNVVNLLGACTENFMETKKLYVIIEYCEFGSLHNFLVDHRKTFISKIMRNSSPNDPGIIEEETYKTELITTEDILIWAFQIACGMEYLASRNVTHFTKMKKVLHGDLAARNILLAAKNVVKICDFGLSKKLDRVCNYNYKKCIDMNSLLPYKWIAIESIKYGLFSIQSDCWSFGIVLWELFSLGDTPYPGMAIDENFVRKLSNGYRMDKPVYAPIKMYDIMLQCWCKNPEYRPKFSDLVLRLGSMISDERRNYYIKLNNDFQSTSKLLSTDYLLSMLGSEIQTSFNQLIAQISDGYLVPVGKRVRYSENTYDEISVGHL